MKIGASMIGMAVLVALSGCATGQAPSAQKLRELPLVEFGDKAPDDKEFVLHFAAGKPIPTSVAIKGNIFSQEAEDQLNVKLRHDIYVYRDWISFDRVNWVDGNKALGVKVEIKLPGYEHPRPGYVHIQMDLKPEH